MSEYVYMYIYIERYVYIYSYVYAQIEMYIHTHTCMKDLYVPFDGLVLWCEFRLQGLKSRALG